MTPNQLPPLQDVLALARKMKATAEDCSPHPSYSDSMIAFRTECIPANVIAVVDALAALAQHAQPVHQFRRRLCADWYDGHPDHEDGGGPYETRILYTTQPAPQPAPVDERAEFEASMREKHGWVARDFQSDSFGYFDGHTATAWLAWQARAALQSPAPQTKGQS